MMFEFLEQLRQKSKEERKHFALLGAVVFTSFLVLIWLSTLFITSSMGKQGEAERSVFEGEEENQTASLKDIFESSNTFFKQNFNPSSVQEESAPNEMENVSQEFKQTQFLPEEPALQVREVENSEGENSEKKVTPNVIFQEGF